MFGRAPFSVRYAAPSNGGGSGKGYIAVGAVGLPVRRGNDALRAVVARFPVRHGDDALCNPDLLFSETVTDHANPVTNDLPWKVPVPAGVGPRCVGKLEAHCWPPPPTHCLTQPHHLPLARTSGTYQYGLVVALARCSLVCSATFVRYDITLYCQCARNRDLFKVNLTST